MVDSLLNNAFQIFSTSLCLEKSHFSDCLCHVCVSGPSLPLFFYSESSWYAFDMLWLFRHYNYFLNFMFFFILVFLTKRDQKALICSDDICIYIYIDVQRVQRFAGQACRCPCGYSLSQAPHCASSLGCAWSGGGGWRVDVWSAKMCKALHGTSWHVVATWYCSDLAMKYGWSSGLDPDHINYI